MLLGTLGGSAQEKGKVVTVEPERLSITYNKTTNIIFPYSIKSVDKGSKDILVQKALGVENVLQLKAARQGFDETNLTVITADGGVHSYLLNYSLVPAILNLQVVPASKKEKQLALFSESGSLDMISEACKSIELSNLTSSSKKSLRNQMGVLLKGIYLKDDVCYFKLVLHNHSPIGYDVRAFRLHIEDKKRSKRTAKQEVDIPPLYTHGNLDRIGALTSQVVVVAVRKFTIPDKKWCMITLQEDNGGRHLKLKIANRDLLNAVLL